MLIEADAVGLEVVCAAYLSQDPVLVQELLDGVNIHSENQKRFNLPSRLIAKTFKFRLIYGGSAFSYANDPDFVEVSTKPDYWQGIIDEYYNKYRGLKLWHDEIVATAIREGRLVMPTGRVYTFEPYWKRDQWVWPRTTILNYPVQGLGNDLLAIARVSARKRLKGLCKILNTVHDSIVVDSPQENVYNVCRILEKVFSDIPENFEKLFGVKFNLPMKAELKGGPNWKDTEIITLDDSERALVAIIEELKNTCK